MFTSVGVIVLLYSTGNVDFSHFAFAVFTITLIGEH